MHGMFCIGITVNARSLAQGDLERKQLSICANLIYYFKAPPESGFAAAQRLGRSAVYPVVGLTKALPVQISAFNCELHIDKYSCLFQENLTVLVQ